MTLLATCFLTELKFESVGRFHGERNNPEKYPRTKRAFHNLPENVWGPKTVLPEIRVRIFLKI